MFPYHHAPVANNKGEDQTAHMRSLIFAYVVHMQQIQIFSWNGKNESGVYFS